MSQELSDLQLKVQTVILSDDRTRKHGIEVIEKDGTIILKGSVPSIKVKRTASSLIRELRDVTMLENKLKVEKTDESLEKALR